MEIDKEILRSNLIKKKKNEAKWKRDKLVNVLLIVIVIVSIIGFVIYDGNVNGFGILVERWDGTVESGRDWKHGHEVPIETTQELICEGLYERGILDEDTIHLCGLD